MAGYKAISILFLVLVVALAGVSPVFAQVFAFRITLTPAAACPGETVTVTRLARDIVGGGISVAAVSPLTDGAETTYVLSSDPVGLIANPVCSDLDIPGDCTFVVSESSCGHYTVIVTLSTEGVTRGIGSADFDVPSTCCSAVGGCVQPVNTFALLSPWLVAIGLVGCIGTVVVVAKKRES